MAATHSPEQGQQHGGLQLCCLGSLAAVDDKGRRQIKSQSRAVLLLFAGCTAGQGQGCLGWIPSPPVSTARRCVCERGCERSLPSPAARSPRGCPSSGTGAQSLPGGGLPCCEYTLPGPGCLSVSTCPRCPLFGFLSCVRVPALPPQLLHSTAHFLPARWWSCCAPSPPSGWRCLWTGGGAAPPLHCTPQSTGPWAVSLVELAQPLQQNAKN